ncbi:MAG TPA: MIP/aquaporin family protein [Verrucomicrobiae bacterium]|jgi:glycerol uptake facilitator protein
MKPYLAEFIGTMLLIIFGDGVVANVVLNKTKGHNSGWIVIATGWGLGVAMGVYAVGWISGGHINPAVTLGLAVINKFSWALVPGYIFAQILGAAAGAIIVWLVYLPHWKQTPDQAAKLAVFCTSPAIRNTKANFISELIGTMVLVFGSMAILRPENLAAGSDLRNGLSPMLAGVLVWAIGLSLGGPTGYAINPARDLGPRLAHAILPIAGKGASEWPYAWIPVVAPITGGILGALFFKLIWNA